MRMKRTIVLVSGLILVFALAAAAVMFYRPLPLIEPEREVRIRRVEVGGADVTGQIDERALLELLFRGEYRRTVFPQGTGSYQITEDLIEIGLWYEEDGELPQIFLSPRSQTVRFGYTVINQTASAWDFPLLDGETLYRQIMELLAE